MVKMPSKKFITSTSKVPQFLNNGVSKISKTLADVFLAAGIITTFPMARTIGMGFIGLIIVRRPIIKSLSWIFSRLKKNRVTDDSAAKTTDDSAAKTTDGSKNQELLKNDSISSNSVDIPDVNTNLIIENQESDFQ